MIPLDLIPLDLTPWPTPEAPNMALLFALCFGVPFVLVVIGFAIGAGARRIRHARAELVDAGLADADDLALDAAPELDAAGPRLALGDAAS